MSRNQVWLVGVASTPKVSTEELVSLLRVADLLLKNALSKEDSIVNKIDADDLILVSGALLRWLAEQEKEVTSP